MMVNGILMVLAWGLLLGLLWQLLGVLRTISAVAAQMHRIPCHRCRFFTGDYRLKCTVHPESASTSRAIGCHDFHGFHPK
ncbi:MAG: hypothetical protein AAGG51_23495 [Cyanobacteria bacterium P01_G01_bin.54]